MTDKIVVFSACGSAEEAEKIARGLLELRLAACVNVIPGVRSFYWWKGAIEQSPEWLLVIKSRRDLFELLRAEFQRLHSYEVPEAIALPIVAGAESYLSWLAAELREASELG